MGADACMVGRAYLYGLAAAGELGVERVLQWLPEELRRTMALIGVATIGEITAGHVRLRGRQRPDTNSDVNPTAN